MNMTDNPDPSLPTLEVAVCTLGAAGMSRVASMLQPPSEGVRYLISWQGAEGCSVPSDVSARQDVRVVTCSRPGLSANRNNALDHAEGDVILIADDDLEYRAGAFEAVRRAFAEHPEVEYASFRHDGPGERVYPLTSTKLGNPLPRGFSQTSFEVALRRRSRAGQLRFCERAGLGADRYICGEEELLLRKAIRRGVECRFFPETIVTHPGLSTGFNPSMRDGVDRMRGVLTVIDHPLSWPVRTVIRCRRGGGVRGVYWGLRGALEACFSPWLRRYLHR